MSEGKSGSPLRLVILLVIMGLLGGAMGYDMYNEVPFKQMEADLESILKIKNTENKETNAITRQQVETTINRKASSTYKTDSGKWEVSIYNYSRSIPFIPGGKIYVVYDGSGKFVRSGFVGSEKIDDTFLKGSIVEEEMDPNARPSIAMGGGAPAVAPMPGDKKEEEKDEKEETKEEDKKADDQKSEEKAGEKKEETQEGGGK